MTKMAPWLQKVRSLKTKREHNGWRVAPRCRGFAAQTRRFSQKINLWHPRYQNGVKLNSVKQC